MQALSTTEQTDAQKKLDIVALIVIMRHQMHEFSLLIT